MNAPKPQNEVQRIKVLWQYGVLDTVPEQVFDELTSLAGLICGAPIAMISLVDEDRQWFKSKTNVSYNETSRDVSMCAHAILQEDIFIVPDATKDRRFKNNPLVTTNPKIRFYAGMPLVAPGGYGLGTLCVIDQQPRQLTDDQRQAPRLLARHVMTLLELRRQSIESAPRRNDLEQMLKDLTQAEAEIARLRRPSKTSPARSSAAKKKTARKAN